MSEYKFPSICCKDDPHMSGCDTPFSLETLQLIIAEHNKHIKQQIDDRADFSYYDNMLKNLNSDNFKTDETLLLYILHNNSVRLQFDFDNDDLLTDVIYQKEIENKNDLFKKIFFQLFSINTTNKDSISSILAKANKYNEHKTMTISIGGSSTLTSTTRYYDTLLMARLLLNNNSLELLEKSNMDIMVKTFFGKSREKLNIFLEEYNKLEVFEQELFLLRHGFISYGLGVRNFDDIDINLLTMRNKAINEFLEKLKTLDVEIDPVCLIPGNKYIVRNNYLLFLSRKFLNTLNTVDFLFNPAGHAYIYGVKVFPFNWHLLMRYFIGRPKDVSEILYINETANTNYPVCAVPEYKYVFKQKGGTSYHVGVTIDLLRKYGILDNEPEKIKDPVKAFCDVIAFKSRQFVIPMKWKVPKIEELIKKYQSDEIANEFLKFIHEIELPNSMVSVKSITEDSLSFPLMVDMNFLSKFELHKYYAVYAEKLFSKLTKLTKSNTLYNVNSPQDSFIKLFQKMDESVLSKYSECLEKLNKVDEPAIDVYVKDTNELLKILNAWKTYYDKHYELVSDIMDCLV